MQLSSSPFPCFNLYISFSLSLSPPFLLHLWPRPPPCQRGTRRQSTDREVPQVFSYYCLLSIIYILSIISFFFFLFFLAVGFHRQLAVVAEIIPFLMFFLIFDMNAWKSVYLPWLLLTWALLYLLSPVSSLSRNPNTTIYPLFSHTSTNTYHISHQHGA